MDALTQRVKPAGAFKPVPPGPEHQHRTTEQETGDMTPLTSQNHCPQRLTAITSESPQQLPTVPATKRFLSICVRQEVTQIVFLQHDACDVQWGLAVYIAPWWAPKSNA